MPQTKVPLTVLPADLSIDRPPKLADHPKLHTWLKKLTQSLNDWVAQTSQAIDQRPKVGVDAELPPISPGFSGRSFFATDTKKLYIDDGLGNWRSVTLS